MARKILLADDSVTAQNMGRKILADAGYEVIAVNNGSAALKKIAELKPDLVILDVYMPGYSGLEVCQRLKEAPETARIPVLLTVGKLEPFKPEEAQRVRAEAFIVKPFEASELLSALSKLEDKVVPRPEPSRPGRFARAFAAAEESGRVRAGEENGWKSRISFPHEKTTEEEKAEKSEAQGSIYNPINRDLRTIVETPQEKAEERAQQLEEEEKKQESPGRDSETIDVAALAPPGVPAAGLPKDVTQEEIAAVTAAAAQMQALAGATQQEQTAPEATSGAGQETVIEAVETVGFEPPMREIDLEAAAPSLAEPSFVEPSLDEPAAEDAQASETQDLPVTMAATADPVSSSGESRWTAVAVALEGDEAGLSLDHEMQKASAPAETNPDSDAAPASQAISEVSISEASISEASISAEASVPETAQGPSGAPEIALATGASTEPAESSLAEQPDASMTMASTVTAEQALDSFAPESVSALPSETADAAPDEPGAETNAGHEITAPIQSVCDGSPAEQAAAIEISASAAETETTYADFDAGQGPQRQPVTGLEPAGHRSFHSTGPDGEVKTESQPTPGNQTVESTAAAWANWRQIRDAGKTAQGPSREADMPALAAAEMNAAAVAAGAEQGMPRVVNPEEVANSSDVASIVDSVLANLRPRLMQEISRKIAEKK